MGASFVVAHEQRLVRGLVLQVVGRRCQSHGVKVQRMLLLGIVVVECDRSFPNIERVTVERCNLSWPETAQKHERQQQLITATSPCVGLVEQMLHLLVCQIKIFASLLTASWLPFSIRWSLDLINLLVFVLR